MVIFSGNWYVSMCFYIFYMSLMVIWGPNIGAKYAKYANFVSLSSEYSIWRLNIVLRQIQLLSMVLYDWWVLACFSYFCDIQCKKLVQNVPKMHIWPSSWIPHVHFGPLILWWYIFNDYLWSSKIREKYANFAILKQCSTSQLYVYLWGIPGPMITCVHDYHIDNFRFPFSDPLKW